MIRPLACPYICNQTIGEKPSATYQKGRGSEKGGEREEEEGRGGGEGRGCGRGKRYDRIRGRRVKGNR